jgi:hypothetical protein
MHIMLLNENFVWIVVVGQDEFSFQVIGELNVEDVFVVDIQGTAEA